MKQMCSSAALSTRRWAQAIALLVISFGIGDVNAEPLRLSKNGTGQAVYLPYYTAADGRSTLLTVVNNDLAEAKAVRVVFAEAKNGRPALEFNIYLTPGDTWAGTVVADVGSGNPGLVRMMDDTTCAFPKAMAFTTAAFAGERHDGAGERIDRTLTGAIEIIELGVPQGPARELLDGTACGSIETAFASGLWSDSANAGMGAPQGGLTASAEVLDVAQGRMWSIEGIAVDGFAHEPRHDTPSRQPLRLTDPQPMADGTFSIAYERYGAEPSFVSVAGIRPAEAISLVFAAWALSGDYALTAALEAQSEWIVSFPTRHAFVDDRPGGVLPEGFAPIAPFREVLGTCELAPIVVAGRDAQRLAPPFRNVIDTLQLCDQVNLLSLARPITTIPEPAEGRVWIDFADLGRDPMPGTDYYGMPVVGMALQAYTVHSKPARALSLTSAHALKRMSVRPAISNVPPIDD